MLVTITKAAGFVSDAGLVHSLRTQSSELWKLAHDFSDIYDTLDIFCFYELLPSRFGTQVRFTFPLAAFTYHRKFKTDLLQIVNQNSAVIEGQLHMGLSTDPSGLNKYRSRNDPNFVKVAQQISNMVNAAKIRRAEVQPPTKGDFLTKL